MLLDLAKQEIAPYFTDARVGKYVTPDNPAGVTAITFLPHPVYQYSFPPESVEVTGPEIVLVTPPGKLNPMINAEGLLKRQYDLWIKCWQGSELVCEEIACELYTALSPNAIYSTPTAASEQRRSPSAYCIKLCEWVHLPR